ncbi:MAG: hypothetical protein R2692_03780 [Microbacterium sp.]
MPRGTATSSSSPIRRSTSAFYGPFRDAVESTSPATADVPARRGERPRGVQEALVDIDEGADIVMVKPMRPLPRRPRRGRRHLPCRSGRTQVSGSTR